jgi:hypothetical protein
MIKRRAAAIGVDGSFAGPSLRSGFATEAYAPKAIGTRHHAPRTLEVGKCDVWLCRLSVTLGEIRHDRRPSGQDFSQYRVLGTRRPLGRPALRVGQLAMSRGWVDAAS